MPNPPADIVVGVMAYNEAADIRYLLHSLLVQTIAPRIRRIVVIASECTDETVPIALACAERDDRIVVVEEPVRKGKVHAINRFLGDLDEPIVVISGADLILEATTLEHLIAPFADPEVGMVGAHPVPTNEANTVTGFAVRLMWELHHRVALREPKMGELVAFRNQVGQLDPSILADEVAIEQDVRAAGLRVAYAPEARVRNHGPESLREFVRQRERWFAANVDSRRRHGSVSTLRTGLVLRATRDVLRDWRPRWDWVALVALIELWARLRAVAFLTLLPAGNRYRMWKPIRSTKMVERSDVPAQHQRQATDSRTRQ